MKRYEVVYNLIKNVESPIGAEIGVMKCVFSEAILNLKKDLKLLCVDPFSIGYKVYYRPGGGRQHAFSDQKEFDNLYENAVRILAAFGDRATLVRKASLIFADDVVDGSLDFVFIDADHMYESVKKDIHAWEPKVKKGGFVIGHDYSPNNPDFKPNVCRAVDEIYSKDVLCTGSDSCWWVEK